MTRPRPSCSSRPARGQGAVELLVALPVLLLLVLSVLQFSLVFSAQSTFDQAMFRGVRSATLDHGSLSALRTGAAQALAALYPNGQSGAGGYALALAKAQAELALPNRFQVVVLNPTAAAMAAWDGPYLDQGRQVREIPQAHLIDTTLGSKGGETLQAANLLSVQGRWCQPLIVPLVSTVIAHLMAPLASGWEAACYAQGGMPLLAQSTQLMQSTLWPQNIQAALGTGTGAQGGPGAGGTGGGAPGGGGGTGLGGGGTTGGGSGGGEGGNSGGSDAPPDHFCVGSAGTVQTGGAASSATGSGA